MTSVFLKTTLITTYKLNFDTLNLQKKKQKIYFKDKDINNKFLQLFFCKNLLLVSKNKYFLNNIKKYFSFRLGFFFFKKNIFFFFWFFKWNNINLKHRFFFFNLLNIIFFKNLFLFKFYGYHINLFFFFNKKKPINLLKFGFKGFLLYSKLIYTKISFQNISSLSIHGVKNYKKYYSPLFYKYQQIYYSFPKFIRNKYKKRFFFFNHKRYVRFKDRRDFKNNYISLKYKNISQLNFLTNLNISFFFNSNLNSFNNFDYIYMYIYNNSFNISNILINFINSLFFFWLTFYKLNSENIFFNSTNHFIKNNFFIKPLFVKLYYSSNKIFFTNYNFIKFFSFCFTNLPLINFYYLKLNDYFNCNIRNCYFSFLIFSKFKNYNNIYLFNLNSYSFYIFLLKKIYFFTYLNTLSNLFFLMNDFFFFKNDQIYKLPLESFNFTKLITWSKNNIYQYIKEYYIYIHFLFNKKIYLIFFNKLFNKQKINKNFTNFVQKSVNSHITSTYNNKNLLAKLVNSYFILKDCKNTNTTILDDFSNSFFNYQPTLSYLIKKFCNFWHFKINSWTRFNFFNVKHIDRFTKKLLYLKKFFQFLDNDKYLFFEKINIFTLLKYKTSDLPLITTNKIYLLLSGNFFFYSIFNFFTLFSKYYFQNTLKKLFFLNGRISFKNFNSILKYLVKKKLKKNNNITLNINSSIFLKIYNSLYLNLFWKKNKFFHRKNNLKVFTSKYYTSFRFLLNKVRFFNYLNKSLYGFNFFFKLNQWFLTFDEHYLLDFTLLATKNWYSNFINILLNNNNNNNNIFYFSSIVTPMNNTFVNYDFYLDFYYKYKQLFFFLGQQLIKKNTNLFNSFNFSLFLYNKNYNWFFFNYLWKWFFINILFKNKNNDITKLNNNLLLIDEFLFSTKNQFNFFLNYNYIYKFNNIFKYNTLFSVAKHMLNKNLSFFDDCFWSNIFYTKLKKNTIYTKLYRRFGKLCISAKYFTFNFFKKKKKKRSKYLFRSKNFDFLQNLQSKKLFLLNQVVILVINIQLNNTFITLTDIFGNVLLKASAGLLGIRGPKRATPVATEEITNFACQFILNNNYNFLILRLNGLLRTRKMKSAIKAISEYNFIILRAFNYTPKAHNGIRFKKRKRL